MVERKEKGALVWHVFKNISMRRATLLHIWVQGHHQGGEGKEVMVGKVVEGFQRRKVFKGDIAPPAPKLACFVLCLKIFNTLKNNICIL